MPDNLFCSKCGAQNLGNAGFCQKCGASLWPAGAPGQSVGAAPVAAYAQQPIAYAQPVTYAPAVSSPYGGFWIRLLAHLVDHIVVGVAAVPLYFIMVFPQMLRIIQEAETRGEPSPEMVFSIIAAASVFACLVVAGQWLYEALLTSSPWQGTIGKKILRLKVTDEAGNRIGFGRSTGRFFAKILSSMVMCIGFIMIAFTDRKRGLHDMLAGTLVMKY